MKCEKCYFFDSCDGTKPCEHFYSLDVEFEDDYLARALESEQREYEDDFLRYIDPFSDGNFV